MEKLRIGIIGAGSLSDVHIQAYRRNPGVDVVAICDKNIAYSRAKAEKFNIPRQYENTTDLISQNDIDAVSIITWNNTHMPLAVAALNAGKHVLCEKPTALNAAEALLMQKAAKDNNKLLMIGFVRRFAERVALAKQMIVSGDIGDIYYIKTEYLRRAGNPGGWFTDKKLSGGGPLLDLGVHMIDQGLWFMGDAKPVSVFGQVGNKVGPRKNVKGLCGGFLTGYTAVDNGIKSNQEGVEDFATALIRFDNGAIMQVCTSWTMHIKADRVNTEVHGSRGGLLVDPGLELYTESHNYIKEASLTTNIDPDFEAAFNAEISHFVDCIRNKTACISHSDDGVKVMAVIDAIYESAEVGESVKLDVTS